MNNNQQTKLCVLALLAVFSLVTGACPIAAYAYHTAPQLAAYDTRVPSPLGTVSPVAAQLSTAHAPLYSRPVVTSPAAVSGAWWGGSSATPLFPPSRDEGDWDAWRPYVPTPADNSPWLTASPAMRISSPWSTPRSPAQIEYRWIPGPLRPVVRVQSARKPEVTEVSASLRYAARPWYA